MTQEIMTFISDNIFGVWFLIGAALVFWMQAGFAMVEAGFTRAKNTGNILMKNLMDFCIGTVMFILIGFSFLLGEDVLGFIGKPGFDLFSSYSNFSFSSFVFNLVFCATTVGLRTATSLPFLRILPASGWYKPNSTLISVLLPAPFSPSRACTSPLRSCRVISSFALIPGNSLVMWSISITKSSANLLTLLSCQIDTYTILCTIIPYFCGFAHFFLIFWRDVLL